MVQAVWVLYRVGWGLLPVLLVEVEDKIKEAVLRLRLVCLMNQF